METVLMKLVGAIVVGGQVVSPPAVIECSPAEAANYARRGKAVPATDGDAPSAVTPSAEHVKATAAELRAAADAAAEALRSAQAEADKTEGKTRAQRKVDAEAVDAAKLAAETAEAAAAAAEAVETNP